MSDPSERQRTILRAPRVEFDLSALALGTLGYLLYQWSWPLLGLVLGVDGRGGLLGWQGLRFEFFRRTLAWIGMPMTEWIVGAAAGESVEGGSALRSAIAETAWRDLPNWKLAAAGIWIFVLWSLVAGAIARVYAVRIARDESIGAGAGLRFAATNLRSFVLAPLFVVAATVFFLGLAALVGVLAAIPYVGPFVEILAYPCALVAALVVAAFAIGGIFGFPMMHAALATERNGILDAVSRTFSYVFTRPVLYGVCAAIVVAVAALLAAFGGWFLHTAARAVAFGARWNDDAMQAISRGGEFGASQLALLDWPSAPGPGGVASLWFHVTWFLTAVASLFVHGYVLAYFVGGLTDTYFLLRREVDGIEETEVHVEGEEPALSGPLPNEPAPAMAEVR
jgi:hypothetical protein